MKQDIPQSGKRTPHAKTVSRGTIILLALSMFRMYGSHSEGSCGKCQGSQCSRSGINPGLGHNYRSTLACMKFCSPREREVRMVERRGQKLGKIVRQLTLLDVTPHITRVCGNCTAGSPTEFQSKRVLKFSYINRAK